MMQSEVQIVRIRILQKLSIAHCHAPFRQTEHVPLILRQPEVMTSLLLRQPDRTCESCKLREGWAASCSEGASHA